MPPIIVRQSKEYSQDLRHNIPLDWIVHHTPYGYMDRYGWHNSMTQVSNICGTSPVNNQILFFDGHDSQFNNLSLTQTQRKISSPSYLKWVAQSTTSPITTGLTQNWRLTAVRDSISWSIFFFPLFYFWICKIESFFLPYNFLSLRVQGNIFLFILFLFGLQSRSALYHLEIFIAQLFIARRYNTSYIIYMIAWLQSK